MRPLLPLSMPAFHSCLVHETPDQVLPKDSELLQHAGDRPSRDVLEEDVQMPQTAVGAAVPHDVPGSSSIKQIDVIHVGWWWRVYSCFACLWGGGVCFMRKQRALDCRASSGSWPAAQLLSVLKFLR